MSWVFNPFTGNLDWTASGATTTPEATQLTVRNETGVSIATTRAVYVSGFNNYPLVALADNTDETKHNVIGVTIGAIAHEADGTIATGGEFSAETNAWNVGDELYLSTSGQLTTTEPTSGSVQHIGIVTVKQNYPVGKILLYTQPEGNIMAVGSTQDAIIRMGDNAAANKVSFRDYANNEVAYLNSDGVISVAQGPVIGGFTLTVPASGTAALLATANIFTTNQKINCNSTTALLVEQTGVKSNVLVVDTTNGYITTPLMRIGSAGTPGTTYGFVYTNTVNVENGINIANTSSGTGGIVTLRVANDTNDIKLQLFSVGYTTSGLQVADRAIFKASGTGGFLFGASNASGVVGIFTGGLGSSNIALCIDTSQKVGIGRQLGETINTKLEVVDYSATTNAAIDVLRTSVSVTGTGGSSAGFGPAHTFYAETATNGSPIIQAQIAAVWVDATNATRKAKLKLSAYDTSARLGIEIEASGSAPKLGFFGATPVVKPSAYTPTNVSTDRSYDADATTVDELADVLGTLIADLQGLGLIG